MKSNQQLKFKETEIGKIPKDWDVKKAEEFCFKITDGTHDSPKKNKSGKYLITSRHLNKGYLDFSNAYFISEKDFKEVNKRSKVNQWDVIIGMIGTIGETYLEKNDKIDYAIKNVGLFKSSGNEIIGKWIFYSMQSKQVKEYIRINRSGTTQEYITLGALRRVPISYPKDKSEMIALVGFLDSLQGKIEILREMNKTLEAIGQAVFEHWFVDFEFPNDEGKPYKSSGGEMIDSELGEIPKGWEIREIKDYGKVVCGKTPSTRQKENYGDDIAFITIPDMRNQTFVVTTGRKLSDVGAESQKKKELPPLSVCVSCIATPGLVSLTYERSHTNQQINSIICNENINRHFMYYSMVNKSDQIKTMGLGGTATLNLNTGDFSKIKVIVPAKTDMQGFGKLIQPIFDRILGNIKENLNLSEISDSLLPRLMSGRIRVGTNL